MIDFNTLCALNEYARNMTRNITTSDDVEITLYTDDLHLSVHLNVFENGKQINSFISKVSWDDVKSQGYVGVRDHINKVVQDYHESKNI